MHCPLVGKMTLAACALATSAEPTVTIRGGADESGHHYTWTITHDGDSAIVSVEIPHYMANLCLVPDGWTEALTNPLGAGGQPGTCIATATADTFGLVKGRSGEFRLRVAPKGTPRGTGTIIVTFADGTRQLVTAQVPVRNSLFDRNVPLIGLSLIFVAYLAIRAVRNRRRWLA